MSKLFDLFCGNCGYYPGAVKAGVWTRCPNCCRWSIIDEGDLKLKARARKEYEKVKNRAPIPDPRA